MENKLIECVSINKGDSPAAVKAGMENREAGDCRIPLLAFRDISIASLDPPHHILSNITGYVVKGGLTALIGASGSGKTLLMRALCGRESLLHVSGSVSVNGKAVNVQDPNQSDMGFVPQEDMLIGELTVRETFRISARLRLKEASEEAIEKQLQDLIEGLGLQHVADNVIGTILKRGLSGGEKRRVSVGVELAARPSVIFLDEPTSGLDASSAYVVIKSIRNLARNSGGKLCVMASLHQPNSRLLNLFDDLLLLGRGGMVYFGGVNEAVPYFNSLGFPCPSDTTPTDYFVHIIDQRFTSSELSNNNNNNNNNNDNDKKSLLPVSSNRPDMIDTITKVTLPPTLPLALPPPSSNNDAIISNSSSSSANEVTIHLGDHQSQCDVHHSSAHPQDDNKRSITSSSSSYELQPSKDQVSEMSEQPSMRVTPPMNTHDFDFATMYHLSNLAQSIKKIIALAETQNMNIDDDIDASLFSTSWMRQFTVLTHRNWMVAYRDVTLYWLQFILNLGFGFMVGVEFYNLPKDIGPRLQDYSNGIVWLVFVGTYLHVFKVYYLMNAKQRYHHERAHQFTSAYVLADLLVTSIWTFSMYIPGLLVGYFMMGLPAASVGYSIFVFFIVAMTAESLMDLLCQFPTYVPNAILIGQGSLVIWCVFAGGAFIRWQKVGFWIWLSESSLYTWSTRGLMINIFSQVHYSCSASLIQNKQCMYNGLTYPCDSSISTLPDGSISSCSIRGSTVLDVYKGVSSTNEWFQLGILIVIMASFRIVTYLLLRYPVNIIKAYVADLFRSSALTGTILEQERILSGLSARVQLLEGVSPSNIPFPKTQGDSLMIDVKADDDSVIANKAILRWTDLRLSLRSNDKVLVDDVNGYAKPGRVLAIMGPSGAGKTTMLNALSGRAPYAKISGTVLLGQESLRKDHLDYVPQFDSLNPVLTVYQTLCIMALLKNSNLRECKARVNELLNILGLTPHKNATVGSLNSGDRKRVNIGVGLISNPSVLFLDEPTTGLDSEAALVVVDYLVKVTRSTGVVCVMTIHQPSANIFNKLDDLLLLTKGQTAYFGEAKDAHAYFTNIGFPIPPSTNPSDFYLDLVYAKSISDVYLESDAQSIQLQKDQASELPNWKATYEKSDAAIKAKNGVSNSKDDSSTTHQPSRPSEWSRLLVLIKSRMMYFWMERSIYIYRLVELVLIAIFIGTLFYREYPSVGNLNEIAGATFFSIWVVLFAAVGATPIFVRDRVNFENEYLNGAYEVGTYCIAQFTGSFLFHLITAIVYQTIVWFMVGFNDSFEPWLFSVLSTLSLLLLMEGISLLVVEFLQNDMLSTTFSMVVLGFLFLFPGFFIKVPDMIRPIFWLSWVVPTKYSLDSQLYNIFHGQSYSVGPSYPLASGDSILSSVFKLDGNRPKWGDWAVVIGYVILFRFLHYGAVRFHFRNFTKGQLGA